MAYLTLLAKVTAKADCEQKLFSELQAMVEPSRAEPGCIKYVLHRLPGDARTFWFVEEWKDQAALDEHKLTPHYKHMKERTADLVEGGELIKLDPVV